MARMSKKGKGKRAPRRRAARRVPRAPRRGDVPDRASLSENKPSALLDANKVYQNYNLTLAQFPRASQVAKGYQYYRIKKVHIKLSPLADTFISGSGTSVPYLYYMIDRTRMLSAANTQTPLKLCGAKPRRFDEKVITFSYTPSVQYGVFDTNPPPGQSLTQFTGYKVAPWVSTRDTDNIGLWNPDTTDHTGCVWIVENNGSTHIQYKCEMVAEFEFKKPSFQITPLPGAPEPVPIETLDFVETI